MPSLLAILAALVSAGVWLWIQVRLTRKFGAAVGLMLSLMLLGLYCGAFLQIGKLAIGLGATIGDRDLAYYLERHFALIGYVSVTLVLGVVSALAAFLLEKRRSSKPG